LSYSVRVQGLSELRRALRSVDRSWGTELGKANQAAARVVAQEASRRAPRGPHEGGGSVSPISSTITAQRRQNAATVAIGGARSPHAVVIEFGGSIPRRGADQELVAKARRRKRSFRDVGIGSRTSIAARPYLYPAIEAKTGEVVAEYEKQLGALMLKVFNQ
jgi:hypothetical protein